MFYRKFRLFIIFCFSFTIGLAFAQFKVDYKIVKGASAVTRIEFNVNSQGTKLQEDNNQFTLIFPVNSALKIDEKDFINSTKDFLSDISFNNNTISFKLKPSYNIIYNDFGVDFSLEIFPDTNTFFDDVKKGSNISKDESQKKPQSFDNPVNLNNYVPNQSNTSTEKSDGNKKISELDATDKKDPNDKTSSVSKRRNLTHIISTDISSDVAYTSFKRDNYLWLIFNSKDLIPRDKFSLKLLSSVGTIISTIQGDYSIVILELFDDFIPSVNDSFGYYDIILTKENNVNYNKIEFMKDKNTLDNDAMFIPFEGEKKVLSLIDPIFEDVVNVFFSKNSLGGFAGVNFGVTDFYISLNGIAFSSYFDDLYYRLSEKGIEIGRVSQIY